MNRVFEKWRADAEHIKANPFEAKPEPAPRVRYKAARAPALLTRAERRVCREALAQLLAGENFLGTAAMQAAQSALDKLQGPDPAQAAADALWTAYSAFAHDDEGEAWGHSLILRTRRALRALGWKVPR